MIVLLTPYQAGPLPKNLNLYHVPMWTNILVSLTLVFSSNIRHNLRENKILNVVGKISGDDPQVSNIPAATAGLTSGQDVLPKWIKVVPSNSNPE